MAKVMWMSVVLVLAMASSTAALMCWSCDECLVQPATLSNCPTELHYCMTRKVDGSVKSRGCSFLWGCQTMNGTRISLMDKVKARVVAEIPIREKDDRLKFNEVHVAKNSSEEGLIDVDCCSTDFCNLLDNIYVPVHSLVPDDYNTDVPNRIHEPNHVRVPDSTPVPDRSPMPNFSGELLIECYNNGSCKIQSKATSSKVQSNEDFNIVQSNATSSKVQSNEDFNIVQNNATSSKVQSNEDFNIVQNNATSDIFLNHATCSKMTKLLVFVLPFALYLLCC